jgi:hypothetical protein
VTIEVSARSGPAGILRFSVGQSYVLAEVVELCIRTSDPFTDAIVVAQVTDVREPQVILCDTGEFAILTVKDNGKSGDLVNFGCGVDVIVDICDADLGSGIPFIPLTHGNITVTPTD